MTHQWLETPPRSPLAHLPTRLEPLDRLSAHLGGPRIWLKRDDCTGLATGGNKTRKLEYLMGNALANRADVVVTHGAVQSNHARQTAAACARLGIPCHLILARKVPWDDSSYERLGNVQYDRMLGAQLHLCEPEEVEGISAELARTCEAAGQRLYTIPTGGSNAVGALGYARCAAELITQIDDLGLAPSAIVHASASAGTQAGLLAGLASLQRLDRPHVIGIKVSEADNTSFEEVIFELANEVLSTNGLDAEVPRQAVCTDPRFLGDGYGLPTTLTLETLNLVGRLEGILFDPVYSGKALGGLVQQIRDGEYRKDDNVIFIHTGGVASLPVYGHVL